MRQFLAALLVAWTAACIAAYLYSQQQHIPTGLASALLPAFLVEIAFYLFPGFAAARRIFERLPSKAVRALLLAASAVLPYVLATTRTHQFGTWQCLAIAALAAAASFWYVALKRGPAVDFCFLAFMAVVYAARTFAFLYPAVAPHLALDILGRLMWIRIGITAVLSIRGFENIRFGFLPSKADWRTGVLHFLFFLPIGALLAWSVGMLHFRALPVVWWKYAAVVVGTFLGMLWVVALGEEFFFRGFLQALLSRGIGSDAAGLVLASILFGMVHLPFRHFPNWRLAILAGLLGLFCGLGFLRTRSVRTAMVTHAIAATTFRLFIAT